MSTPQAPSFDEQINSLVARLVTTTDAGPPLTGCDAGALFRPDEDDSEADRARNCVAALMVVLAGHSHAKYPEAVAYIEKAAARQRPVSEFLHAGWARMKKELRGLAEHDETFAGALADAAAWATQSDTSWDREAQSRVWSVIFPEGVACLEDPDAASAALQHRRTVQIDRLNESPLSDPASQLLITSNVLITTPISGTDLATLDLGDNLRQRVDAVMHEQQEYWYDHPIHIGVEIDANEAVYGLRGLNDAIAFEKQRGNAAQDAVMTCLLSVSVTHRGLADLANDYLSNELAKIEDLPHVRVVAMTERQTDALVADVLIPAAEKFLNVDAAKARELLEPIIGVDGEYGRHYSMLKAIAAVWHVLIDGNVTSTFKFDLDQVFPQDVLVEETGMSAFDHFKSPLWGAIGRDDSGEPVELGMLAGALVNEKDIGRGLFTPDVPVPTDIPAGEACVFFNKFPMAVSTDAEMMTRYADGTHIDGKTTALHRIHVTGGTNGILIDALRTHRPFTPTFIGRAEDQAYLMSVLFERCGEKGANLRYAHRSGLIMRHDKEAFAGASIAAAKGGRFVGDLARTLFFSYYASALTWGFDRTKAMIDPFTGCFSSRTPLTLVYLRLAVHVMELFASDDEAKHEEAASLLALAERRLEPIMEGHADTTDPVAETYRNEREGWDLFYDALDALEEGLANDDADAIAIRDAARAIIDAARIKVGASA